MIAIAAALGFTLGVLVTAVYYRSRWQTLMLLAESLDPEQPLKLSSRLSDLLKQAAAERRAELHLNYTHLARDVAELMVDQDMHNEFVDMVDELRKSIDRLGHAKKVQTYGKGTWDQPTNR